jgi:uncharacterized protein (TIGR04255 family)
MADFVYESAPLVEVIAEVHWHIERLSTVPDGGLDPQYAGLVAQLEQAFPNAGFPVVERLVPPQVPIELLADKPVMRFWRGPKQYPLIQIGPGLMTVNIVPPYEGWKAFKPVVLQALDVLKSSYPMADALLKFERAELRYLDGFTRRHGLTSYAEFIQQNLDLSFQLPSAVTSCATKPPERHIICSADFRFPLHDRPGNAGLIRLRPGTIGEEPGAILDCAMQWQDSAAGIPKDALGDWFDEAHTCVSNWFFAIVKQPLVAKFGAKRSVKS